MPVKNVKRKTNDGFEGVITGLNDKEKEIIASSVDNVKANPTDEATETLEKLKVNNVTYNIGAGGGATYTAGKNISISEANEISVANTVSNLTSIDFVANFSGDTNLTLKDYNGLSVRTKNSWCPSISFVNDIYSYYSVTLTWKNQSWGGTNYVYFDFKHEKDKSWYVFTSRSTIPDVPTSDGTYVLKATVSSGTLTYSWVKEGE